MRRRRRKQMVLETLDAYLSRGGKIQRVETGAHTLEQAAHTLLCTQWQIARARTLKGRDERRAANDQTA